MLLALLACMKFHFIFIHHVVVPQMSGHGAQQYLLDPSSYWGLRDCKYKGEGTTLMMFDGGIDWDHPSFANKNNDKLFDKDRDGHGTLCAGIACGDEFQNEHGICCGVAPGAKLEIWNAYVKDRKWLDELQYLTKSIKDRKFSIDVLVITSGYDDPIPKLHEYIKKLDSMGVIIVCAGSNEGAVNSNNITYPARYDETICVGSNDRNGGKSSFSPEGIEMQFLALGEKVYGPECGGCVTKASGTSYAAPALGGLICLLIQVLKSCKVDKELVNRYVIVHLLKLLTNKNGDYGAIAKDRLKSFFEHPDHFIKELRINLVIPWPKRA